MFPRSLKSSQVIICQLASFKLSDPDSVGVKIIAIEKKKKNNKPIIKNVEGLDDSWLDAGGATKTDSRYRLKMHSLCSKEEDFI